MYKVVTHTIKEEHFDHPYLAEQGMAVHTGTNAPMTANISPKRRSSEHEMVNPLPKDGNTKIKMALENCWEDYEWFGDYWAYGDLNVEGILTVGKDLVVSGSIAGRGSMTTVTVLDTAPEGNTWTGNIGEMARTSSHMYLCVNTDNWIRWPIQSSW